MLEILRQYISETATPEMAEALEESVRIFDLFEIEDYEREYMEILHNDDQVEPGQTLLAITDMTVSLLRQILARHGITLIEGDIRLSVINMLVRAVHDLQNYEDKVAIISLTSLPTTQEEILAECLALVCHYEVPDIMVYLDNVDRVLIQRLAQISLEHSVAVESIVPDENAIESRIAGLKELMRHIGAHDLYVARLIESNVMPGYLFDIYLNPELGQLSPRDAARELLAAAFVCRDATKNPRSVIAAYLEKNEPDPERITQINIEINKMLLAANSASSTTGRAQT